MSYVMKGRISDGSTPEAFCFSVFCEECGQAWTSKPVRFSKAGVQPETEHKRVIYKTLYQREKSLALGRAMAQAEERFSQCPICGRIVCDRCFMICEDLDMCSACALRLHEEGQPVQSAG